VYKVLKSLSLRTLPSHSHILPSIRDVGHTPTCLSPLSLYGFLSHMHALNYKRTHKFNSSFDPSHYFADLSASKHYTRIAGIYNDNTQGTTCLIILPIIVYYKTVYDIPSLSYPYLALRFMYHAALSFSHDLSEFDKTSWRIGGQQQHRSSIQDTQ
jgi:hypothetical protein